MKLITEHYVATTRVITEAKTKAKTYTIEGIFIQTEKKNKNGRIYPRDVIANEVKRYQKEYIDQNRALGELGHPAGPILNLERVSHIITGLRQNGNDYIGKAKVLDTDYGKIVKCFIDEGVKLGVSTRGVGSIDERNGSCYIKDDFVLSTVDIVADPSAPDAFVEGIMEGKEWVWNNGIIQESKVDVIRNELKKATTRQLDEAKIKAFAKFMQFIKEGKTK